MTTRPGPITVLITCFAILSTDTPGHAEAAGTLTPAHLRCEYRVDPLGVDATDPRLSWEVRSEQRGQMQTAYHLLVASSPESLQAGRGDLWNTGKVASGETLHIAYAGRPLASGQLCYWKVKVWDKDGRESPWSEPARWSVGLLRPEDWKAEWISFKDARPLHADRRYLHLPPARHYRKVFTAAKPVRRATAYASALGIYELHLNGKRAGDAYLTPGWSDYHKRAYYNALDVTALLRPGENAIGAVVADGWYAGYLGYALFVSYGPNRAGRALYGKTPALLVQLDVEYADGSRELVVTDPTWQVTADGPIREADMLMGETFDARRDRPDWCTPGFDGWPWEGAVRAEENGSTKAVFTDILGDREVELGFQKPPRMQSYPAPPIRVMEEVKAVKITEPQPGAYVFDLGQNFAGFIRLKVKGPAGAQVKIRHGEMLHPDGKLMTENLRKARATDYYTLRGDPDGEIWSPRFTYHGFQYVELTGLTEKPGLDAVTGLALHNDTPLTSAFECSDEVSNKLFRNIVWTQRSNFIEVPTDCPQRDERLGWMGDAQMYARTATFNADVAAFFTKWLDDVEEAQRSFGAYPDYCPYPLAHGAPRKTFGTGWMDAGVICPWTVWQAYGDTRVIERHYASMTRFMEFRQALSPGFVGVSAGNPFGDWLALNETTPVEYIDACYYALTSKMMAEMAEAIGRKYDAANYRKLFRDIQSVYVGQYVNPDGTLKVPTQTAHVLALAVGLLPDARVKPVADHLAGMIAKNDHRMATGFIGTRPLPLVLSSNGRHDLAVRLFQSRKFPSWGYEVVNGATTIWERWDSYTKADGFGRHNAAMNSFSHYTFGAVGEWMFRALAGIDTDGPGYKRILIRPGPPAPDSNPDHKPIDWVKAEYRSIRGPIAVRWQRSAERFDLDVTIPANTTATVVIPAAQTNDVTEGGRPVTSAEGVQVLRAEGDRVWLAVGSGTYRFAARVK